MRTRPRNGRKKRLMTFGFAKRLISLVETQQVILAACEHGQTKEAEIWKPQETKNTEQILEKFPHL